jgi:hypothetical protein
VNLVEDDANDQTVTFSLWLETSEHAVRVSETTAHALLVMLQLWGEVRDGRRPHRLRDRSDLVPITLEGATYRAGAH